MSPTIKTNTKTPDASKTSATPKPSTDDRPKPTETAATTKPVDAPIPTGTQPTADANPKTGKPAKKNEKAAKKIIVSISVNAKLARQVKLLASLEGSTISSIFVKAIERDISARLKRGLAEMTEVE
jgi:hypothetical protein